MVSEKDWGIDVEKALVEGVLRSPVAATELIGLVEAEDFSDPTLRDVFRTARGLAERKQAVNAGTVRRVLKDLGLLSEASRPLLDDPPREMEEVILDRARWAASRMRRGGSSAPITPPATRAPSWENGLLALDTFSNVSGSFPEVRWLLPGWLPRGMVTVLASSPGEGKSALALEVVRRVLSDRRAFAPPVDTPPTGAPAHGPEGGEAVVYVDCESAESVLATRVAQWGIDATRLRVFSSKLSGGMACLSLDHPDDWSGLSDAVIRTRPALVVVDSLSSAHAMPESPSRLRAVMLALVRLARNSGSGVLLLHHLSRRAGPDRPVLDRLRGSPCVAQLARCIWAIDRPDPADPRRRLGQIKNSMVETPGPVGFTLGDKGLAFTEAPKGASQTELTAGFLGELLAAGPMAAGRVLRECEEYGLSRTAVWRASHILGVIRSRRRFNGPWRWSLPAGKGRNP